MARPTSRDDLLAAAADGFVKLNSFVDGLPAGAIDAEFAFEDRDRNVRDVLWHLHTWHQMVIEWHRVGTLEGGVPAVPGEGIHVEDASRPEPESVGAGATGSARGYERGV